MDTFVLSKHSGEAAGKFDGVKSVQDGVGSVMVVSGGVLDGDALVRDIDNADDRNQLIDELGYPGRFIAECESRHSKAGIGIAESCVLADCVTTAAQPIDGMRKLVATIDEEVDAALLASTLAGFRRAWLNSRGLPIEEAERDELAEAATSNDVVVVGRLLGARDVNQVVCTNLPGAVARRPTSCVLLDVAVGAGAVEVSKCLLEFHKAKPTRETLKMAISSGNLELIRLIWARLPMEQHMRGDLLEVAADFHRDEPLSWLFRDSSVFEQELFFVFALEEHLADGLLEVLGEGVRPWWQGTHRMAAKCRAGEKVEFGEPPEGFRRIAAGGRTRVAWFQRSPRSRARSGLG
jgi:hypothetical protein